MFIWIIPLTLPGDVISQESENRLGDLSRDDASGSVEPATSASSESAAMGQNTYRLPPPGKDPRMHYLFLGEEMLRSGKLGEAREAFEKALELDSQDPNAQYFLGLIDYEEGNIEEARIRLRMAHERLAGYVDTLILPTNDEWLQLEFSEDDKSRVYYRDGWYITPKSSAAAQQSVHLLKADSTYKINLEPGNKRPLVSKGVVGLLVLLSFFLAR